MNNTTTVIKTGSAATVKAIHGAGFEIKLVHKTPDNVWTYSVEGTERQIKAVATDLTVLATVHVSLVSVAVQGLSDGVYVARQSGYEVEISGMELATTDGIRGYRTLYAIVANGRVQGFRG